MKGLLKLLVVLAIIGLAYTAADHAFPKPMAGYTLRLQHWLAGMEPHTVQVAGFDISYLDSVNHDGEPLVLVHGIGADKDNFAGVAMLLRGHGRIIALDLPGFGDSSKPTDADYSIAAQAECLGQFLDALKLPRAHLGGNSMGGAIILEFARQHPDRVQSLWLLDPAGVRSAKESEMLRRYRENGEMALFARTPEQFQSVLDIAMARQPPLPYSLKHELALAAAANYPLHTRIFKDINKSMPALEETAAGLPTPTLIVWGEQDRVLDVSGADILHHALPNSQEVIMPGIGHLPMLEDPYHAAADYKRFRAGLSAASATTAPEPAP